MAPIQGHQGGAGSFGAGGNQSIRQAGAVAGALLAPPEPGALGRSSRCRSSPSRPPAVNTGEVLQRQHMIDLD
ncbi:MAG: hypothetical protein ACK5JJ_16150 [Cyanobacteriota bacterium]